MAFALTAPAEDWEIGAAIGYGVYHNGSVISPGGTAHAGIRNRFVAGAVVCEDLYEHVSGELRYTYHDGDPFLSTGSAKINVQGQSHAVHYDLLLHLRSRDYKLRPYAAAGVGVKDFKVTGPAPASQALASIGELTTSSQLRAMLSLGAGVKYDIYRHLRLRFDIRDYITPFPKKLIVPVSGGTARGILHQFTPMFGVSLTF